jgi:prepilin-type N-terminal cleavage/methylation domain-containing protein
MDNLKKAFTIIELMSVIIVIGILAGLAIPSYRTIAAHTQQEKMKNTLRLIAKYEEAFFIENGYYTPGQPDLESYNFEFFHDGRMDPEEVNLSELPFIFPDNKNYDYRIYWINNEEENYFFAQAIASIGRGNDIDGDVKMDNWQVSSYNPEPVSLSNDLGGNGTIEEEEEGKGKGKKKKEKKKKKSKP